MTDRELKYYDNNLHAYRSPRIFHKEYASSTKDDIELTKSDQLHSSKYILIISNVCSDET